MGKKKNESNCLSKIPGSVNPPLNKLNIVIIYIIDDIIIGINDFL